MIEVADASAERWDDLLAVFGERGDPPRCWCQWFRVSRPEFAATTLESRRDAFRAEFDDPRTPGVLAYADGVPVGWCAVAPRADYRRLRTYPPLRGTVDEDGLWSVTCFVVRVGHRRQGFAEVLLDGAIDFARRHQARLIEAYPLDTSVRKAMAGELFHGPLSVFLRAGFVETGRRSSPARPIVRLAL